MKQGKEAGAKKGMWMNGKPPFPYYYDKNTKLVLVDEGKHLIYRAIVDKYLSGINLVAYCDMVNGKQGNYAIQHKAGWKEQRMVQCNCAEAANERDSSWLYYLRRNTNKTWPSRDSSRR
ncbi:hypothetical protein D3C81_1141380 [compost metagenome]